MTGQDSQRDAEPKLALHLLRTGSRMRVGRKLGRTLYVESHADDPNLDVFIGVVDSPELARLICDRVNRGLSA